MKKLGTIFVSVCFLCIFSIYDVCAAVKGDDYPQNLKIARPDTLVDSWTMYNRECVSFVAWRLHSQNDFELPRGFGSAWQWEAQAKSRGFSVNQNPTVGSVAWFRSGHVAWVAEVLSNEQVVIEEYNYGYNHNYHQRTVQRNAISSFIHFKDINQKTANQQLLCEKNVIHVGQRISFSKVYRVSQVNAKRNSIASDQLSGGKSTYLNYIDAVPLDKTDDKGNKTTNQVLSVGDYFRVNGQYYVLAIDYPSNGIKVKIGNQVTWLDMNQAKLN